MKILKHHMLEEYGVELGEDATVDDFIKSYIANKQAKATVVYPQQMHFINITINSFCNLNCYSCDQFIDSAPSTDKMTLDQIKDFVKESQELNWRWDEIRVTGGEPSLHKDFFEILNVLNEGLKQKYLPQITLKIISNGTGNKVRSLLDIENAKITTFNRVTDGFYLDHIGHPDWLVVCSKPLKDTMIKKVLKNHEGIEKEAEFIPDFGNVFQAPVDRLEEIDRLYKGERGDILDPPLDGYYPPTLDESRKRSIHEETIIMDCQVHASCGFELSSYGISPCGCGGGRVVQNSQDFFPSLKDVTVEECVKKLEQMCSTCGQNMNYMLPCSNRSEKTEFWKVILKEYNSSKETPLKRYNPFNK